MYHYKAVVAYDGSDFHGMASQKGVRTVADVLTAATNAAFSTEIHLKYAGRTDAGVHATGQVISFALPHNLSPAQVQTAVNGRIPDDLRLMKVVRCEADFEPRHDAKSKTYKYVLNTGTKDPLASRYVYQLGKELDLKAMKKASKLFLGEHSFLSFSSETRENTVRTITRISIVKKGDLIEFTIVGRSFLRYMVRMMVGSLLDVGLHKCDEQLIEKLLKNPKKGSSNRNAPAYGLTLIKVTY